MVRLFNTMGREVQDVTPLVKGVVSMYSCGPTVYNYIHIGNLRSFLLSDIVRRTFEYNGYRVKQVMNITDFGHLVGDADDTEDKMSLALMREHLVPTMENMYMVASRYAEAFKDDITAINIKRPHEMPRASEHVPGMIAYVQQLLEKGYAYPTADGIYFDTAKFKMYGALGGSASADHSRTGIVGEKKNFRDFALWKFSDSKAMGWDAPWGRGFPGWHIECTAMSTRYLGKSFDIHTGGVDHIAVHHTNEIAQAEAANNVPYATYWLHNEFIQIDNTRIAKSLGNEILLRHVVERGLSPLAYRYWLLTGHYRQAMNFTWEAVEASQTALYRALRVFVDLPEGGTVDARYHVRFLAAINNDLDTPGCIALMWELLKDARVQPADKRATLLDMDRVLGIGFALTEAEQRRMVGDVAGILPPDIEDILNRRKVARDQHNFALADQLRDELLALNYVIKDTPDGQKVERRV